MPVGGVVVCVGTVGVKVAHLGGGGFCFHCLTRPTCLKV
jgi:hypothetical protein